jgi:hypothetical protein
MRQPGQGMPIAEVGGGKGPAGGVKIDSLLYLIIFGYISRVVKINEFMSPDPSKDGKTRDDESSDDKHFYFLVSEDHFSNFIRLLD